MPGHASRRSPPRRSSAAPSPAIPAERPSAWALAILLAWIALLLLAPPESNHFWALNGLRSISWTAGLRIAAVAAVLGAVASRRTFQTPIGVTVGALAAAALAFPLREKIHFLGDSALRFHAIYTMASPRELFADLHAPPLDVLIDFQIPIALHRSGLSVADSISVLSLALAALFLAGIWRLARRLAPEPALRLPIALALGVTGALEAFAGYAESTALLLALTPWWWAELLAPLETPGRAMRVAAAWGVLLLAHRVSLVLVVPMLWRGWGPALEGDRPAGRRAVVVATAVTTLLGLAALRLSVGSTQMGTDVADAFALLRGEHGIGMLPFHDVVNLLVLVAPLAVLAPLLFASAFRAWWRTPRAKLILVAAIPLVPLALVLPAGPHGFGAHRDWDLAVLCGWTLTLAATTLLATATPARARGTLRFLIPALALFAGGWVAVNADEQASAERALALATRPPLPAAPHRGALHQYLGQRAADLGQFGPAGHHFERSYDFSPNPRFLLRAAEARLMAGDLVAARRDIGRARASQGLNARGIASAGQLERMIEAAAAESAAASPVR